MKATQHVDEMPKNLIITAENLISAPTTLIAKYFQLSLIKSVDRILKSIREPTFSVCAAIYDF